MKSLWFLFLCLLPLSNAKAAVRLCAPLVLASGASAPLSDWVAAYQALLKAAVEQGLVVEGDLRAMLGNGSLFTLKPGASDKQHYIEALFQLEVAGLAALSNFDAFKSRAREAVASLLKEMDRETQKARRAVEREAAVPGRPYARLRSPTGEKASYAQFLPGGHRILTVFKKPETVLWNLDDKGPSDTFHPEVLPTDSSWIVGRLGGPAMPVSMGVSTASELGKMPGMVVWPQGITVNAWSRFDSSGRYLVYMRQLIDLQNGGRPVVRQGFNTALTLRSDSADAAAGLNPGEFWLAEGGTVVLSRPRGPLVEFERTEERSTYAVAYSPLRKGLLLCAGDSRLVVRHTDTGSKSHRFPPPFHTQVIKVMVVSPDGRYLAMGSEGGNVLLWDLEEDRFLTGWQAHSFRVIQLAFSDDGELLLSASGADEEVRVWSLDAQLP